MKQTFKPVTIALVLAITALQFACNDEWKEEQYERYVSFKAPVDDNGVTRINVRYKRDGKTTHQLPVIVSGSTDNDRNMTVRVAVDPDTLKVLNVERFQSRLDLYYRQLESRFFGIPETVGVKSGENVSLMNIDFTLKDIDLADKWILPLTILADPSGGYAVHPRKHYRKALLRVMPFNDYSGVYSGTALRNFFEGYEEEAAIVKSEIDVYTVDENTVFFYAGTIDENRTDRHNYKIYARFDTATKAVNMWTDNPRMNFTPDGDPVFSVREDPDEVRPYLIHRYVTVSGINYKFTDYTYVPDIDLTYVVKGLLILERKINTQIPDEDQAIEW